MIFSKALERRKRSKKRSRRRLRYGWRLHAFVIMRNHYHLAVETPEPNLSVGMQWLQSTFGTRFNRFRDERGYLFQGRFQGLIVEDRTHLARLVDYIHLNPQRAGIITLEQLGAFRWSSLHLWLRNQAFAGLEAAYWLGHHGLEPSPTGWTTYLQHLRILGGDEGKQKEMGFETMSRGWAIGTAGWRKALAKEPAHVALNAGFSAQEARELRESAWLTSFQRAFSAHGQSEEAIDSAPKFAPWKIAVAHAVRQETGAAVSWLCGQLKLGTPDAASVYLSRARRQAIHN